MEIVSDLQGSPSADEIIFLASSHRNQQAISKRECRTAEPGQGQAFRHHHYIQPRSEALCPALEWNQENALLTEFRYFSAQTARKVVALICDIHGLSRQSTR